MVNKSSCRSIRFFGRSSSLSFGQLLLEPLPFLFSQSLFILLIEISLLFAGNFLFINLLKLPMKHPDFFLSVIAQLLRQRIPNQIQNSDFLGQRLDVVELCNLVLTQIHVFEARKAG